MVIKGDIKQTGNIDKIFSELKAMPTVVSDAVSKAMNDSVKDKTDIIKEYRKEASRLAALGNKRLKRLESSGLESSPAYQSYIRNGGEYFSVKGKSFNEVQAEVARMRKFINAETSTVRGLNSTLKEMATNINMKYKTLAELREKSAVFFQAVEMVENYLRQVHDIASAIGYQKIFTSINQYVEQNKIDLSNSDLSVEDMVQKIAESIAELESPEYVDFGKKMDMDLGGAWYNLSKGTIKQAK